MEEYIVLARCDRVPEEIGLRLRRAPSAPRELPVTVLLRNHHSIADWELFLCRSK